MNPDNTSRDVRVARRRFLQSSLAAAIGCHAVLPSVSLHDSRQPLLHPKMRELVAAQGHVVIDPWMSTFDTFSLCPRLGLDPLDDDIDVIVQVLDESYVVPIWIRSYVAVLRERMCDVGLGLGGTADQAYVETCGGRILSTARDIFDAAQLVFETMMSVADEPSVRPPAALNPEILAVAERIRELNPRWLGDGSNPFRRLVIEFDYIFLIAKWPLGEESVSVSAGVQERLTSDDGKSSGIRNFVCSKVLFRELASLLDSIYTLPDHPYIEAQFRPRLRLPELCVKIARIEKLLGFEELVAHTAG